MNHNEQFIWKIISFGTVRGARGTLRTDSKSKFDLRKLSHVEIYEVSQNMRFSSAT